MFFDTEFSNGTSASNAPLIKWCDTDAGIGYRKHARRSMKRVEAENVRNHVAEELAEMAEPTVDYYAEYDADMEAFENDEILRSWESGDWDLDNGCGCDYCRHGCIMD